MSQEIFHSSAHRALKQIRLDAQITQKQLAEKIGRPQSFVSKYENGDREIEFITVYQVCCVLNKSLEDFQELFESYF